MDAIKLSNNEIQVTKQPDAPAPIVTTYKYDFLLSQKERIIADANKYLAARQKELDEVLALIAKAEVLGATGAVMPKPLADPVAVK